GGTATAELGGSPTGSRARPRESVQGQERAQSDRSDLRQPSRLDYPAHKSERTGLARQRPEAVRSGPPRSRVWIAEGSGEVREGEREKSTKEDSPGMAGQRT